MSKHSPPPEARNASTIASLPGTKYLEHDWDAVIVRGVDVGSGGQ